MADLRIVDAPVLLQESITDDVKMPTGGLGNYAIRLGDLVWYVVTKEQLANKNYVDLSTKGVKDSLDEHIADKNNPHQVTKEQVGLGNVDNTADIDKPVSNAVSSAITTATNDMATKTYVNSKMSSLTDNKADKATTLVGYGIIDAYTKSEIDTDYSGVKTLYGKNVEVGAGINGWTDSLVQTQNGRTQRDKNADTLTPHDFGAVGNGVADDTQALQKFFNNTQKGGFSRQNAKYKVTATINIPTGFYFDGCGCAFISDINSAILKVADNASGYTLQNFKIKGKGKADENQRGLHIVAGTRFSISNVYAYDIAGIGFLQEGGTLGGQSSYGQKGHFVNVRAFNCWVGRKDSPNAYVAGQPNDYVNEYCTWIGFEADECEIGNITSAGNNSFIGGKLTNNTDGLWLVKSANSTHGVMVGVQINHNRQYNVNIDSQTAGFEFSGCTVYGDSPTSGVVRVVNSRGIKFNGGQFEASVYCDGQYSNVLIANVYNNGNFEPVFGGTHPENIYKCGWMSANLTQNSGDFGGMSKYNDTANDYVYAVLSANFTAAAFNDVVVNFDTVKKSLRKRFNNGVYTCPWDGVYTVKGNLFVTGGGGFAKLVVNDLDYGGYFTLNKETQYGSYNCGFDADVICKQGDKIELHICTTTDASIAANQSSYLTVTAK